MLSKQGSAARYLMLFAVVAATVLRQPELMYTPRFFAEEGQGFFAFAHDHSLWSYLTSPMYGYYALYNVIATFLATLVKLEAAPLITCYLALAVQIAASAHVIFADLPILNGNLKRFLVAISLPLICPSQIWLTTIGVQYWLCLISALILLESPADRLSPDHLAKVGLLFLNGLTGILSCLMIPLFLWKWRYRRAKQHLIYALVLAFCLAVQGGIVLFAYFGHDSGLTDRFVAPNPVLQTVYESATLLLSRFFLHGEIMNLPLYDSLDRGINSGICLLVGHPVFARDDVMYLLASLAIAALLAGVLWKHRREPDYLLLAVCALGIYGVSVALSIKGIGGHRYMFAPLSMLMILIVAAGPGSFRRPVARGCVVLTIALMLASGIMDYRPSMNRVYNDGWPRWADEVHSWRADRSRALKIWPPPWEMHLN